MPDREPPASRRSDPASSHLASSDDLPLVRDFRRVVPDRAAQVITNQVEMPDA